MICQCLECDCGVALNGVEDVLDAGLCALCAQGEHFYAHDYDDDEYASRYD